MTIDVAHFHAAPVVAAEPARPTHPSGSAETRAAATEPATGDPVTVDTVPSSPPPEVWDAMTVAHAAAARLAARGCGLHFDVDARTGHVHIELHDLSGNVLATVPPTKALEIAAGAAPDH